MCGEIIKINNPFLQCGPPVREELPEIISGPHLQFHPCSVLCGSLCSSIHVPRRFGLVRVYVIRQPARPLSIAGSNYYS